MHSLGKRELNKETGTATASRRREFLEVVAVCAFLGVLFACLSGKDAYVSDYAMAVPDR